MQPWTTKGCSIVDSPLGNIATYEEVSQTVDLERRAESHVTISIMAWTSLHRLKSRGKMGNYLLELLFITLTLY